MCHCGFAFSWSLLFVRMHDALRLSLVFVIVLCVLRLCAHVGIHFFDCGARAVMQAARATQANLDVATQRVAVVEQVQVSGMLAWCVRGG